jgi:hypothetical protein
MEVATDYMGKHIGIISSSMAGQTTEKPAESSAVGVGVTASVSDAGPSASAQLTTTVTEVAPTAPGIRAKTLSPRQIDEVRFWTPQFKEHAFFLYLGLEPTPMVVSSPLVPSGAAQAPKTLQTQSVENARLVAKLKYRAKNLTQSWAAFEMMVSEGKIDMAVLCNLVNHLRYLKSRVMDLQRKNVWVGWLFPEFVEHIRDELDYFVARFNDTISPDAEKVFWLEINAEHLAFTAHLLNTDFKQSKPVVDQLLKLSEEGMTVVSPLPKAPVDLLQMAELSRRFDHLSYANKTQALHTSAWNNGAPTFAANIHPVLAAHVIREGQRSIDRLTALGTVPPRAAGRAIPRPF